jgi:hypothetical protein
MEKLKQIHEQVKNHPFRLDKSDWKGYYKLLGELDKEFTRELTLKFNNNYDADWGFFIHELRSAIWNFMFEYNIDKHNGEYGRISCNKEKEEEKYGIIVPEYQKKIVIILESYIQQIHKFITTNGVFEEFITYYLGCDNPYDENAESGRWNKFKLNKDTGKFKFAGKLK